MNLSVLFFNFSTSNLTNNLNLSAQTTTNSILSNDTNIHKHVMNTIYPIPYLLKLKPIYQIQPRKQRVSRVKLTNDYITLLEVYELCILS